MKGLSKLKEQKAYSLAETIVTLAVTGLIVSSGIGFGIGVFNRLRQQRFNAECEKILNEILATRDAAMIYHRATSECRIYRDYMGLYEYDSTGKTHYREVHFENVWVEEINTVVDFEFTLSGTKGLSKTLVLKGEDGEKRNLVFQPGTGRIYFNDAR